MKADMGIETKSLKSFYFFKNVILKIKRKPHVEFPRWLDCPLQMPTKLSASFQKGS